MTYWKFISTEKTETECFLRRLFGHTGRIVSETGVELEVKENDTLFLHQWKMEGDDRICGPFVAASDAQKLLNNTAWNHKSANLNWQVEIDWVDPVYSISVADLNNRDAPLQVQQYPQEFSEVKGLWLSGALEDGMQIVNYP